MAKHKKRKCKFGKVSRGPRKGSCRLQKKTRKSSKHNVWMSPTYR